MVHLRRSARRGRLSGRHAAAQRWHHRSGRTAEADHRRRPAGRRLQDAAQGELRAWHQSGLRRHLPAERDGAQRYRHAGRHDDGRQRPAAGAGRAWQQRLVPLRLRPSAHRDLRQQRRLVRRHFGRAGDGAACDDGGARPEAALHRCRISRLGAGRLSPLRAGSARHDHAGRCGRRHVDPRIRLSHRHVRHGRNVRRAAENRSHRHGGPAALEGRPCGVESCLPSLVLARYLADHFPRRRILLFRQHPAAVEFSAQPVEPRDVRPLSPVHPATRRAARAGAKGRPGER